MEDSLFCNICYNSCQKEFCPGYVIFSSVCVYVCGEREQESERLKYS